MNTFYFFCNYEGRSWGMRATVYSNNYLFLYEIEPEDRMLNERFGVKFFTRPRDSFFEFRCTNAVKDQFHYELAILAGLRQYLHQRAT
ncbi:MAG TPA: hypothetical protein VHE34_27710 [Puia sp.]|uniref:hypothetical protein n=1 Tax=Puia sp. TaxID=2045100 RepID=UPI002C6B932C|nr:hypothetical protein [Puia sp.]HVU99052.1 hypothetical protein [Puia sp.]